MDKAAVHTVPRIRRAGAITVVLAAVLTAALVPVTAAPQTNSDTAGAGRPEYRVGVGDRLSIFVYGEAPHDVFVRPDGRISLPLVGDVDAEGLTARDLASFVARKLEPFQKDPNVTVSVSEIHSYRIYVLGKVGEQGMIESIAPLRVLQAVAMARGFNEFASRKLTIIRETPSGTQRIEIDYDRILNGKAPEANIVLLSGDMVVAE